MAKEDELSEWKEWVDERWGGTTIYCPHCNESALKDYKDGLFRYVKSNFCPNCGFNMKGGSAKPEKVKEGELVKAYAKGFDTGVKTERQHSCEACKYRLYAFDGHPCVNCRRNFKLVDEIREQKNDLWKDGTLDG